MDKKLEEAIKFLKNFISLFYEFPNPQSVSIKDSEIKNVETVLNYIDNSISTEVIEEKIKYKKQKIKNLEDDRYRKMCLQIEIDILEELLEGK